MKAISAAANSMDQVILIGSETVASAGHQISSAAEQMKRAASEFDYSVTRLITVVERLEGQISDFMDAVTLLVGRQKPP